MSTHKIPDKLRAKVDKMYSGLDHERVIKALESGKTIYRGGLKFQGVKVDKAAMTPPTAPPADSKSDSNLGKEKGKDK